MASIDQRKTANYTFLLNVTVIVKEGYVSNAFIFLAIFMLFCFFFLMMFGYKDFFRYGGFFLLIFQLYVTVLQKRSVIYLTISFFDVFSFLFTIFSFLFMSVGIFWA